jgi:glutamine transport system substrate-binding protein
MAASTRSALILIAITCGVWALAAILLLIRWHSLERPGPPLRGLLPYGELRIGVDASNPPFAVATADDLFGLEIDLGRALGQSISAPVRFVNMTFDGLYDSLRADQVDMVIATLTVDTLRTAEVRYTRPYFDAGLLLISPADTPLLAMSDIAGKHLAYEFGSSADGEARRWLRRIHPFHTQPYELPWHALDAVRLNKADAALVDATTTYLYLREHPGWRPHTASVTHIPYVIATRIDRQPLWAVIEQTLQTLQENGALAQIIQQWL